LFSAGRSPYDVRAAYEVPLVRHLGGLHTETGSMDADTTRRVSRGNHIIRQVAKSWSVGTYHGRESGLNITTRLQLVHTCAVNAMLSNCRSRP
jgi:hypothetical protein